MMRRNRYTPKRQHDVVLSRLASGKARSYFHQHESDEARRARVMADLGFSEEEMRECEADE